MNPLNKYLLFQRMMILRQPLVSLLPRGLLGAVGTKEKPGAVSRSNPLMLQPLFNQKNSLFI